MSILSSALKTNRNYLKYAAEISLKYSLWAAKQRVPKGNSLMEANIVASVIFGGLPILHTAWSSILSQYNIRFRIGGAFCHQSPFVKWKRVQYGPLPDLRAELGDLLICYYRLGNNVIPEMRALLLQVKCTNGMVSKVPKKEQHQLDLYKHIPKFIYDSPKFLKGQRRYIQHWAGIPLKYLIQDKSTSLVASHDSSFHIAEPDIILKAKITFEEAFVRLLTGSIGRRTRPNENKGWSKVVRDLLDVGRSQRFNFRMANWIDHDRIYMSMMNTPGNLSSNGNGYCYSIDHNGNYASELENILPFPEISGINEGNNDVTEIADNNGMPLIIMVIDESEAK